MSETPVVWTTRLTTPGAGAFAVLFGIEALGRALVAAALPLQTLELIGSDEGVSTLFLMGAAVAIAMAFVVPRLVPMIGRARVVTFGILLIGAAAGLFTFQELPSQVLGFVLRACGVAILYAGLSLFIMDHIRRQELGRSEPLRMLSIPRSRRWESSSPFSATPWGHTPPGCVESSCGAPWANRRGSS